MLSAYCQKYNLTICFFHKLVQLYEYKSKRNINCKIRRATFWGITVSVVGIGSKRKGTTVAAVLVSVEQ